MQDSLTEQLESLGVDFMLRSLSNTLDADVSGVPFHEVLKLLQRASSNSDNN